LRGRIGYFNRDRRRHIRLEHGRNDDLDHGNARIDNDLYSYGDECSGLYGFGYYNDYGKSFTDGGHYGGGNFWHHAQ